MAPANLQLGSKPVAPEMPRKKGTAGKQSNDRPSQSKICPSSLPPKWHASCRPKGLTRHKESSGVRRPVQRLLGGFSRVTYTDLRIPKIEMANPMCNVSQMIKQPRTSAQVQYKDPHSTSHVHGLHLMCPASTVTRIIADMSLCPRPGAPIWEREGYDVRWRHVIAHSLEAEDRHGFFISD